MSWLSGILPQSSSAPLSDTRTQPSTALQQQRRKQIDSLQSFHHTVILVQRDVEYKISFSVNGNPMALHVFLPSQFPNEKPIVTVSPPCSHPWLNDQMIVIGCPTLNAFYMHSILGKVLQDIVKEFCENPPQMQLPQAVISSAPQPSQPQSSSSSYSPLTPYSAYKPQYTPLSIPSSGSSSTRNMLPPYLPSNNTKSTLSSWQTNVSTSQRQQPVSSRTSPFPDLQSLSIAELNDFQEDPEVCLKYIRKLDEVGDLKRKRAELMKQNEEKARENLEAQPAIEAYKDSILNKYMELTNLKQEFDISSQKQQELMQNFAIPCIHNNLQISVSKTDTESEEIAEKFVEGSLSLEKFLSQFMEKRKSYHLRLVKEEKVRGLGSNS